jgi:hypothetical protein
LNTAYLTAGTTATASNFYVVDLATGFANFIDTIGTGLVVSEMAVSLLELTLPVTLIDFSVVKDGATSKLSWTTETEINNDYFILERSGDGRTFAPLSNKIFSKAVGGNSTSSLGYGFIDITPLKGRNFYRLSQADKDQNIKYSKVLQVSFDGIFQVRMFPNPVRNVLNVRGNIAETADVQINVVDATGRLMKTYTFKNQQGDLNIQLQMSSLNPGLYRINLISNQTVFHTESVMKF